MKKLMSAFLVFGVLNSFAQVKLGGSDILAPIIEKDVLALAKNSGVKVESNMRGTYMACPDLNSGAIDVAIIACPKGRELPKDCVALPIAYQVAIVVVNSVNPIEEISTKQLYSIYSRNAEPRSETWANAGVNDASLRNIMPLSTSFSDGLVVELFKAEALNGTNLGSWVNILKKKQDVLATVKTNNSAIGIVGKVGNTDMIKIMPVAKIGKDKSYAYSPDTTSIYNGDYPFVLPFYVVFKKTNVKKVKPLVRILLDDKIANSLDNTDFYSSSKESRKKSIFELDLLK